MNDITPDQMAHLTALDQKLKPLLERFERLSQPRRVALLESVCGAYVRQVERELEDTGQACDRAIRMLDAMLKRQEEK